MPEGTCSVDGCDRPWKSRQMCHSHYMRWLRAGGSSETVKKKPPHPCSVEGCEERARTRDMCPKHYERWRRHGDPLVEPPRRSQMRNGYWRVWCPGHPTANGDGYALEHRKVAWDAGILTDLSMHVHHVNHDKTDNRPENLEALTDSEHHQRHIDEAGVVTNQHGAWPVHRDANARARQRRLDAKAALNRRCDLCDTELPLSLSASARFCNDTCRNRWHQRRFAS